MMGRTLPKILSDQEQQNLLSQFDTNYITPHRNLCMVRAMLEAGLRAGEVVALKRSHLDLQSGRLRVRDGKGSKDRNLWISDSLSTEIGSYRERIPDVEVLFPTRHGTQVKTGYLRRMVKREAVNAGVASAQEVSPHTLRHTFATNLLSETKNLELVRKALGHEDISTTQIYLHIADEELEQAMRGLA